MGETKEMFAASTQDRRASVLNILLPTFILTLSLFFWSKQAKQQKPLTIFTSRFAASPKLSSKGLIKTENLEMVQI